MLGCFSVIVLYGCHIFDGIASQLGVLFWVDRAFLGVQVILHYTYAGNVYHGQVGGERVRAVMGRELGTQGALYTSDILYTILQVVCDLYTRMNCARSTILHL